MKNRRGRRTRKRGGMKSSFRNRLDVARQTAEKVGKNSSLKNRLVLARQTEEAVETGVLKPVDKSEVGSVPIPVAVRADIQSNRVEAIPVVKGVVVKNSRDDVGSSRDSRSLFGNNSYDNNFLESKPTVNASSDFIDRLNKTSIPKPPTKPKPPTNRTIKVKPVAPLPVTNFNDPKIKEMIENLKTVGVELPTKLMPPNPPPVISSQQVVTQERRQPDFIRVIQAILEDNIKILTEAESDKTPEIDTTVISKFYNERVFVSNMNGNSPIIATVSGIEMTIPWTILDECTPILIATKFGLVRPCKQIMESVDDEKKVEMLKDFDKGANTPLSLCARYGYQELCEYFIREHQRLGVPMEGNDWDRSSSIYEKTEINELLGKNIELTEPYSVFLEEIRHADPSKIENYDMVLKKVERISLYGDISTKTPLMIASEHGHLGIVELLLCGGAVKKAMSRPGTRKNKKMGEKDLRSREELGRMCANPLAMTSEKKTSLHLCARKCCPTPTSYETVMGDVIANDQYRLQYNQVHDDKYKNMNHVMRFNRIIHLLLRFMIFENGVIGANKRPNGLKIVLQNAAYENSIYDDGLGIDVWDDAKNCFTTFFFDKKINWLTFFQKRTGIQSTQSAINRSIERNFHSDYITPFVNADYTFVKKVFNRHDEKCVLIRGDPNMFIELERGFSDDVFALGEKTFTQADGTVINVDNNISSFADYFVRNVLHRQFYDERFVSANDRVIEAMLEGRDEYNRRMRPKDLRYRVPMELKKPRNF